MHLSERCGRSYLGKCPVAEGVMQTVLLIMLVQALILLALWRWDEQKRHRRHLETRQMRSSRRQHDGAAPSPATPLS